MTHHAIPADPRAELWLDSIFTAKAALNGGVVRRAVNWVEAEIGRERLVREVQARHFHMLECGGQFVIVCNPGRIRMIC
ncbi:N-(5'-phosphoribosyl)anthranilate isomerase [Pelagovum pacificum]|uniref:N-(5'-phosphoribosyl)anthranilate isomerase n=1 Tax=Pelagovum pacificum TaxID=2588711 RepID=A0A5C5GBP0_9RHOB|nr:N-(5'-phosphoribosyl)anthranilate isomerase [Pelagovum pacificum]QQA44826.1 N-(5'-phosphoribosyl)anthranilate isomerase [Pelagovum pacificum]TNY32068.1 N-(5'-phosphoribosyl)anthranilate isomerase [Pelagovum pacificum]